MTDTSGYRTPEPLRAEKLLRSSYDFTASVIVVSFNTRDLLRECLTSLREECGRLPEGITAEILVVDNASRDGSADMVAAEFSGSGVPVRLVRSEVNLGFGVANNRAIEAAAGRYLVLLNSDAFFYSGSLARAIARMEADGCAGVGGARLVGVDGSWQPAARMFPTILRDGLVLTGLAARFPRSRFFSAAERTWADPAEPAEADWVTGAFMILRRAALAKAGIFDPTFFLYCEEVDLCRRIKTAGFRIQYWPDIVVMHMHGESSRQVDAHVSSEQKPHVVLWHLRSMLIYYRKHHGAKAWLARWLQEGFYSLHFLRNCISSSPRRKGHAREAIVHLRLLRLAWKETRGGRVSPPAPW